MMLGALLLIASCKKDESSGTVSRHDMLLGTWRRNLRATDYNNNGRLDSSEILHAPATDTLIFELSPDATSKRTQYYKGAPFLTPGTWHLQMDDQELVFQPSTSTTRTDTFRLDTVSDYYLKYHQKVENGPIKWEAFTRK
jgi:hypothetical protein